VVQDPLYCGLAGDEQYTLRVESYGNPANNGGHEIGAFPVGCIFGTLAGTTSTGMELKVPRDIHSGVQIPHSGPEDVWRSMSE
jgi:hypothetical protein